MGNSHGTALRKRHSKHNGDLQVTILDDESNEMPEELRKRLAEYEKNCRPSFIKLSFIDYAGSQIVQEFYEVFRNKPIGKGSFGEVWLAQTKTVSDSSNANGIKDKNGTSSKSTGTGSGKNGNGTNKTTLRAIKQLKKPDDRSQIDVLKKEVEILRMLRHPSMARCFETFEDRKFIYLVLEFCQGGTLSSRIPEAIESDSASWLKQIMGGVGYLHTQKIVHRDVKPDNFLFLTKEKDSMLKMIDFGLAERFDKNRLTEAVGTPYYVAPEVLKMMDDGVKHRDYTERCDMWSIGVIAFQLFIKGRPFEGTVKQIFQQIMKRSMTSVFSGQEWNKVSHEAKDLVGLLLHRDPSIRLTATQAANHPFFVKRHPAKSGQPCVKNLLTNSYSSNNTGTMDIFVGIKDENNFLQKPRLTMTPGQCRPNLNLIQAQFKGA